MKPSQALFPFLMVAFMVALLSSCDSSTDSNKDAPPPPPKDTVSKGGNTTIPWNTSVAYGSVTDSRDGKSYRTVKIGSQTWMAENLNYEGVGACYDDSKDSCSKYGRLYTWAEVMHGSSSSRTSPSGVKGICPTGWHVPSDSEWTILEDAVGTFGSTEGAKLKSTSGWSTDAGTDDYGFRALPGGNRFPNGTRFSNIGDCGYWWTATQFDASTAWVRIMLHNYTNIEGHNDFKTEGYSLRCTRD